MTITIYKEVLYRRMQSIQASVGKNTHLPTWGAIDQLASQAETLASPDTDFSKPISRDKKMGGLSLHLIQGVPQVKAAKLGAGAFARIYLHVDGCPNQPGETDADHCYAVKVFNISDDQYLTDIETEIALLKKFGRYIRHGVRDLGDPSKKEKRQKHYIVMKYIPGLTLHDFLRNQGSFSLPLDRAFHLMISICQEVKKLHGMEYTHGDLSARNIMITPDFKAELIDFNFSRPFGTEYCFGKDLGGKPGIGPEYQYIAPECVRKENIFFTVASDIYALSFLLGKILNHTRCNASTSLAIQSYIDDMRIKKPSDRPDLDNVIHSLQTLQKDPAHAQISRRRVNREMKTNVILSLKAYQTNLSSYFTVLVDSEHREKESYISSLVEKLTDINIREEFLHTLKEGFMHYFNRFVANNLEKYLKLENLGRGLECFIAAIKACGLEIDVQALIKEVENNLPENRPQSPNFMSRLSHVLSPQSGVEARRTVYAN